MIAPGVWVTGGAIAALVGILWHCRERFYQRREQALQRAVRERTEELDREQAREQKRNQILEMLIANESLGTVLDAALELIPAESPRSGCAILLKNKGGCRVAASLGMPSAWLNAFSVKHAVPFEVWRSPMLYPQVAEEPAWKKFGKLVAQESAELPVRIHSWPVGAQSSCNAALVVSWPESQIPSSGQVAVAEVAKRLTRFALEHSRLYDDLRRRAHYDALTGLPNRVFFEERLTRAIGETRALKQKLAVLFIDLDRFKEINETHSHRVGDLYLMEVANRLSNEMKNGAGVARIGGDEFTVILSSVASEEAAVRAGGALLEAIRKPLILDDRELVPGASIGVAVFDAEGADSSAGNGENEHAVRLIREADSAMYSAKERGGNRVETFTSRNDRLDRRHLEDDLRAALRHGSFAMHYQPKVDSKGALAGFEALVRMNHPKLGQILPAEFIPVAELTGQIVPLGNWVLNEVCRQAAEWKMKGLGEVSIAVNVSPAQIEYPDFASSVLECLARHGVAPWNIELELTEGILIGGAPEVQSQMRTLREAGIRLSIDDFGTGYSSLSYLHQLQVDAIKLDRSFVHPIATSPQARRLVRSMIEVARSLGLGVIAEGVETEKQREALVEAGCPCMQGYLFARPRPAAEMEALIRQARDPDRRPSPERVGEGELCSSLA